MVWIQKEFTEFDYTNSVNWHLLHYGVWLYALMLRWEEYALGGVNNYGVDNKCYWEQVSNW